MTYPEIRAIIQKHAESLFTELGTQGLFHYGRQGEHAHDSHNQPMPQIWMDPLTDNTDLSTGVMTLPIALGFFDQDVKGSSQEEQAAIVDRMKALSVRFMYQISEHDLFDEITATTTPLYYHSTAVLTGVAVVFTVKTHAAIC